MQTRSYRLTFICPAFIGNAEQSGQWRTPPIKALLRQWWRVAYSADHGHSPDIAAMRRDEAALFGTVEGRPNRSEVRIRLSHWSDGKLKSWDGLEPAKVRHGEVERTGHQVGAHAYLGFGPLDGRGGTRFKEGMTAALNSGESAELRLAFPDSAADRLSTALSLMAAYGSLGGRCRNGWGSFSLVPLDGTAPLASGLAPGLTRDWSEALREDWPHALGRDTQPLIWQTQPQIDWSAAMRTLAEAKIGLRTQKAFAFQQGSAREPQPRHWLAYPVTNHAVQPWDRNKLRLPNTLRVRLRRLDDGRLAGVIFHMPCMPPPAFTPDRTTIESVWRQVHAFLDNPPQPLQLQRAAA